MHLFLFFIAVIGGAMNAVAGGGSFIALPSLLYAGVPPVSANATCTFALWPASVASSAAYRRDIVASPTWLALLGGASLAGGFAGAVFLVRTSDDSFMRLLPWLMLLAVATFTFGNRLTARFRVGREGGPGGFSPWAVVLQLVIAFYGGYFGGGMGIMMLATMSVAGMTNIHEMNGLKSVLAVAINGVALVEFALHGAIAWGPGIVMVAGGVIGGYAGATISRRFDRERIRQLVIVIGWAMTVYFFVR